ncbi:hypothetical protein QQG55_5595 [Brugia pahangi]
MKSSICCFYIRNVKIIHSSTSTQIYNLEHYIRYCYATNLFSTDNDFCAGYVNISTNNNNSQFRLIPKLTFILAGSHH